MTAPVGSFAPNEFGLYDMGGNVWQWCEDLFEPGGTNRVLRGSGYDNSDRDYLLSSRRSHAPPFARGRDKGFRCVVSAGSVQAAAAPARQEPAKPTAAVTQTPAMSAPAAPAPSPSLPPELTALDAQFIALQKECVSAPFEADVAKLNTGCLGGIAKKIAEGKAAGHLDGILALEAEQKLLADKQPVPDTDDDKTAASLKALRAIYREAYAKLAATRAANLKALTDPLDKRLAQMESDFTKADRVTDAKTVRGYREALSESSPELQLATASKTPGVTAPPQNGLGS